MSLTPSNLRRQRQLGIPAQVIRRVEDFLVNTWDDQSDTGRLTKQDFLDCVAGLSGASLLRETFLSWNPEVWWQKLAAIYANLGWKIEVIQGMGTLDALKFSDPPAEVYFPADLEIDGCKLIS